MTSTQTPGTLDVTSGNFLKHDGPAGTVTFLVALPLCLGIALGSGAPLFSGVMPGSWAAWWGACCPDHK